MKTLKIKFGLFSLLAVLAVSVFLTSCEQEQLTTEQDFRVSAKYQKKITVTDASGLNSVVLGISSDNKEDFDLHVEQAYSLTPLSKDELKEIEKNRNTEREQTNFDLEIPDDSEGVHIEILSKKIEDNAAALDLYIYAPYPDTNKRVEGYSSSPNWHYSWTAPHQFMFISYNGKFCSGFQKINNGACCWKGYNWREFKCGLFDDGDYESSNSYDTRARVYPQYGGYHYIVW